MMVLKLLALGLTALALVPSAAHLFELRAKMRLTETQYFTVQSIYAGWALFSLAIIAAIVANGALWWSLRRHCIPAARWAMASSLLLMLTLVIFAVFIFPANQATANWTFVPTEWQALRRSWEHGHAVNALVAFAALLATGRAAVEEKASFGKVSR